MDLNQIPLFAALKGKLVHTSQRQRVIAENVANADVPNYAPKDLKPFSFDQQLKSAQAGQSGAQSIGLARTAHAGLDLDLDKPLPTAAAASTGAVSAPDSEVHLDGNHVVLEEQMVKMSEARMDYDTAVGFYQQSLGLLKTAIQRPGG